MGEQLGPCLRCGTPLVSGGVYRFLEGAIIVTREAFQLYVCPRCRKVELYWADAELPSRDFDPVDSAAESTTCLQCGKIIPSGETRCGDCGWTYR